MSGSFGTNSAVRGQAQGQHIVRINIDRASGNYIEGSVDYSALSQKGVPSKHWKSEDDVYTESISKGLTLTRYFPNNSVKNEIVKSRQNLQKEVSPIRSFLINETNSRVVIKEMDSSNEIEKTNDDVKEVEKNSADSGAESDLSIGTHHADNPLTDSSSGTRKVTSQSIINTHEDSIETENHEKLSLSELTIESKDSGEDKIINEIVSQTETKGMRNGHVDSDDQPDMDEETKWLTWMEVQFKKIAGDDGEISLEEFKSALGVKQSFFAERFFYLFDSDKSGSIECDELMTGLRKLTKGSPTEKLKFLFDVYDADGSGTIDIDELKTVLRSCMEESSLKLSEDDLDSLTALLFESADEDDSGAITFEELKAELEKHPGVLENLTISAAQWLKPPSGTKKKKGFTKYFTKKYIVNNIRLVVFFIFYVLLNIGLGGYAAYNYKASNGFIITARICGMNLNFNCMFILVLMLRKSMTYLRMTRLGNFFPLDDHVMFHKLVGKMILFYSIVHTFAHLGNAIILARQTADLELWKILFTTKAGFGWVYGTAIITGWVLDIILVIIFICSLSFIRRGGHFQVFYWTHMLYIPFWILTIIHGSNFWKWFIVPGVIFVIEKISRSKLIKRAEYGSTFIEEITLLPSGVTHLEISRPENFSYRPGDYIFLQIPAIAHYEWHPFTISSAPEMDGRIWLHVRSLGHWTKKVYNYFEQYDPGEVKDIEDQCSINEMDQRRRTSIRRRRKSCVEVLNDRIRAQHQGKSRSKSLGVVEYKMTHAESIKQSRINRKNKTVKVKCFIDGPYGTATREIFRTEHAVLIGAGIGVTPMASILQSVMYRYKESKVTCPRCTHCFFTQMKHHQMKTKKVDFIWINRDQKAFEWFVSLLTNLEVEQSEDDSKIIDLHLFMTAAQKKTDMKGLGLQIALDLMHEKSNKDLITGLKTKTEPGRPNWNKLLGAIAEENKGKVKIFFCGTPQLGKIIKETADKYSMSFVKENF